MAKNKGYIRQLRYYLKCSKHAFASTVKQVKASSKGSKYKVKARVKTAKTGTY